MTLLIFIGVALLIIMLPFSLFGGSIGFGIGPLFHFNLSGAKQKEKERLSENNSQSRIELIQEVNFYLNIFEENNYPRILLAHYFKIL